MAAISPNETRTNNNYQNSFCNNYLEIITKLHKSCFPCSKNIYRTGPTIRSLPRPSVPLKQIKTYPLQLNLPPNATTETVEVHHVSQTEYVDEEDEEPCQPEPVTIIDGQDQSVSVKDRINRARARLRRLDSQQQQSPRTPRTLPSPHRQQM